MSLTQQKHTPFCFSHASNLALPTWRTMCHRLCKPKDMWLEVVGMALLSENKPAYLWD